LLKIAAPLHACSAKPELIASCSWQTVNYGLWIIGAISAAALLLSAVLSAVEFLLAVMNKCGRHTAGLAFPTG
jgi:hypothetical protein